ncbi:MAG TPA: peptide-N4-asparagine amidase [Trebonia sp.]|nr:peptide-N4-asparagine amidase [Trebonia sp.]
MRPVRHVCLNHFRWLIAFAVTILVLGGAAAADAASGPAHLKTDATVGASPSGVKAALAGGTQAPGGPPEFTTTADPVSLDAPVRVPPTRPTVVTIADNAPFGNAPSPSTDTVALPNGHWSTVVMSITGTEKGRQYDRLAEVYDGPTQIFLGVTPEPTPAGITWHVQKDITGYLPILSGTRSFSTYVDNYLSSIDTGIPVLTVKLYFYPAGGGYAAAHVATTSDPGLAGDAINQAGPATPADDPGVPNDVVTLVPSGDTSDFNTINAGSSLSATVTLPDDIRSASLDLYAVGQSTDEFWWGLTPAFREIDVSVDGRPAGVVWPDAFVYTGGVNPLIWRPLTGVDTLDIPSYRLDLTPFAGLLSSGGPHTITLTVAGNAGYWLAGGALLLSAGGPAVSGSVTADTLSLPTSSAVTTSDALGSPASVTSAESASASYRIAGTVTQGGRTWTDALSQSLQFAGDQTNIDSSCTTDCYQWVHQETTSAATETVSGRYGRPVTRHDDTSWTIDAPNGYQQNTDGSDFFIPASVSQSYTDVASGGGYATSLSESVTGYGALEEDNSAATITNGDTTGIITVHDGGYVYQRTIVTHGGTIVQDLTS